MIMTMNKAISKARKNNKKGFTLVELVIVIAILAILSALVIPLISTTIGAAKFSVMESDSETLDMLIAECKSNAVACNRVVTYGKTGVTASLATVGDICYSNQIDTKANASGDTFFTRTFDNTTYQMVYSNGHVCISGGANSYGTQAADITAAGANGCVTITASTTMLQLCGSF